MGGVGAAPIWPYNCVSGPPPQLLKHAPSPTHQRQLSGELNPKVNQRVLILTTPCPPLLCQVLAQPSPVAAGGQSQSVGDRVDGGGDRHRLMGHVQPSGGPGRRRW